MILDHSYSISINSTLRLTELWPESETKLKYVAQIFKTVGSTLQLLLVIKSVIFSLRINLSLLFLYVFVSIFSPSSSSKYDRWI